MPDPGESGTCRTLSPTFLDARTDLVARLCGGEAFEVARVVAFTQKPGETKEAFAVDIPHVIGNLLNARDLEPLAHLDRAHELGCLEQGLVRAGVEPGAAAPELFDGQQPALEID